MKRLFGILIFTFFCAVLSAQTLVPFNPTGSTWKYTPNQQSEFIQIRQGLTLNGDLVYFNSPVDGEILQRYQREDGKHIWTNRPYNTAGYDSLHFSIASGVIALYKDGVAVVSDNLDGRYLKIVDLPTIPTSIWDLSGFDRTGWAEGKLVKFDAFGNLIVGSTSASAGIGLTDLSATSPILYNNITGKFTFDSSVIPNVYNWALQALKPEYTWDEIGSKPTFSPVATTGAYSDLSGKPTIPTSIWSLTGVDRTGWVEDKVLKFNSSGNLIVGTDNTSVGGTGIALTDLSAISPLAYNNTTGAFSIASGYTVPTTTEKGHYDTAYGWGNHSGLYRPVSWVPSWSDVTSKPTFATVATTGAYSDLSGKPVIPINTNQLTNGSGFITLGSLSSTATGLSYNSTTGVFSFTSGYSIPTTTKQGQWDNAYTNMGKIYMAGDYSNQLNSTQFQASTGYIWLNYGSIASGSSQPVSSDAVYTGLSGKQDNLVSGSNIKTINGSSILGSGNISITASADGNNYPTSLSFNYTTGTLTLVRSGLSDLTTSMDGRYANTSHTHTQYAALSGATFTGAISGTTATFLGVVQGSNFQLSDRRLKENIRPLTFKNRFDSIIFYGFTMREDSLKRKRYGVIAQDVEKVAPELVYTDANGLKAVNYIELLVGKVALMEQRIKSLEKRIKRLERHER